jgi:hypothetical protein
MVIDASVLPVPAAAEGRIEIGKFFDILLKKQGYHKTYEGKIRNVF